MNVHRADYKEKKEKEARKKEEKMQDEIGVDNYNSCKAYAHVHDLTRGAIDSK